MDALCFHEDRLSTLARTIEIKSMFCLEKEGWKLISVDRLNVAPSEYHLDCRASLKLIDAVDAVDTVGNKKRYRTSGNR